MINPAKLLKLRGAWDTFTRNHPKFPKFIEAIQRKGITEGTIIEINITTAEGETISSNLKLTESDIALFGELRELSK